MLKCKLGSTDKKQACLRTYKDSLAVSLGPMSLPSPSRQRQTDSFLTHFNHRS